MTTSNLPDLGYRDGPDSTMTQTAAPMRTQPFASSSGAAVGCETFASNTATDLADAGTITFA